MKLSWFYLIASTIISICLLIFIFAWNANAETFSYEELATAIFWSEGGYKTSYPYGIKSVKCDGYEDCRKVCLNTIRNNVKRWEKSKQEGDQRDYLTFLRDRYAPLSDSKLNENWLRNVKWFLDHPKEIK